MKTGDEHGVANGLDRGHVDVVVDVVSMPAGDVLAFQMLVLLKATPKWNTVCGIQQLAAEWKQTNSIMAVIK